MRSSLHQLSLIGASLLLSTGCAGIKHHPLAHGDDHANETGIRYYQASPYLLVFSDGKGGLVTRIYYLPDPTRKMVAEPYNFLASLKATLTFQNGVLTQTKEEVDETTIPTAIIKAVAQAAPFLSLMEPEPADGYQIPAPYLYKIIVSGSSVNFIGGQGTEPILINLPAEDA